MGRVVALGLLVACGGGAPVVPDGGDAGDAGSAIASPAPPVEPAAPAETALPVLTPCPPGWREVAGDPPRCDPWPASGRAECGPGEAHFPGEPGCRRIGRAAPAGEWPDDLPAGALRVRAGAPPGGNGSAAEPFGRIVDAAAVASVGSVIALSRGTFDESVILRPGVTLRGASTAETTVTFTGSPDATRALIAAAGSDVSIEDLTVSGNLNGFRVEGAGRSLTLRGVVIAGTEAAGALVGRGATLEAEDVLVTGVRSTAGGVLGRGVGVEDGGTATVRRAVVERCSEGGVVVLGAGAVAHLEDVALLDIAPRPLDGLLGSGSTVVLGARLELARVVIERTTHEAINLQDEGSSVSGTDVVVRDIVGGAIADRTGSGLSAGDHSTLELSRAQIERTANLGIFVYDGSTATLADVVVDGALAIPGIGEMGGARGLIIQTDATVDASRLLVERVEGVGVNLLYGTLRATDLTVRDGLPSGFELAPGHGMTLVLDSVAEITRARFERNRELGLGGGGSRIVAEDVVVRDQREGSAVGAQDGLDLTLRRALIEGTSGIGLNAIRDGTRVVAEDIVVRDGVPDASGSYGAGVVATLQASLELRRALLERNTLAGFGVIAATATVEDLTVRDTRPAGPHDRGHGVHLQQGATVDLARVLLERNHGTAAHIIGEGTVGTFEDLVVRDTQGTRFMDMGGYFGEGLAVLAGARADVTRALFERNREASVLSYMDATIVLRDLQVLDTLERECAASGCEGAGTGLTALEGGSIEATRFEVMQSALIGVQVARRGTMDLHQGVVAGSPIGANVQTEGFDVTRLEDEVVYRDNGRNLDTAELVVPGPPTAEM